VWQSEKQIHRAHSTHLYLHALTGYDCLALQSYELNTRGMAKERRQDTSLRLGENRQEPNSITLHTCAEGKKTDCRQEKIQIVKLIMDKLHRCHLHKPSDPLIEPTHGLAKWFSFILFGGSRIRFPARRPVILRCFLIFLFLSRKVPVQYREIGRDLFL
jgi:hypothetical protein